MYHRISFIANQRNKVLITAAPDYLLYFMLIYVNVFNNTSSVLGSLIHENNNCIHYLNVVILD
jgi:hypothetical protein